MKFLLLNWMAFFMVIPIWDTFAQDFGVGGGIPGSGVNPLIHSFQGPMLKCLQATVHIFDPLPNILTNKEIPSFCL